VSKIKGVRIHVLILSYCTNLTSVLGEKGEIYAATTIIYCFTINNYWLGMNGELICH